MTNNKTLIGGLAGGVAFFLLGWLIYGILLMDYYAANTNQCAMRPMTDMVMWAMIVSNLAAGLLVATILSWSNTSGMMAGAKIGAIVGLLVAVWMDFNFYSMSTMYSGLNPIFVDILVSAVYFALGGGIIAWVMGMIKGA
ncbi:MAG: hypothetical protein IPG55_13505 [Saprospiraceae bacterium]|nr:hypothetical protein [Candidatus Defluviibacterium haderslevense]MBK7245055.1 hypothetical protein [Candidatus Defluviibacterium haderslevense]